MPLPRGPDEGDQFAGMDRERDFLQHPHFAPALAEAPPDTLQPQARPLIASRARARSTPCSLRAPLALSALLAPSASLAPLAPLASLASSALRAGLTHGAAPRPESTPAARRAGQSGAIKLKAAENCNDQEHILRIAHGRAGW